MASKNAQKESSTRYFETTDLGLAASLLACDLSIININKDDPRRVVFLFEKTPLLESVVNEFWSKKLMISATDIMEQIKFLKTRIYS